MWEGVIADFGADGQVQDIEIPNDQDFLELPSQQDGGESSIPRFDAARHVLLARHLGPDRASWVPEFGGQQRAVATGTHPCRTAPSRYAVGCTAAMKPSGSSRLR